MADKKDPIKDLLLQDYRYRAEGMGKSEQSGETRLSFFMSLITFCATGVGAGYGLAKKDALLTLPAMHVTASGVALALFGIGIVILCRMVTRNENTDLAKEQLDLIRRTFAKHFDKSGLLARYELFPKSDGRKFGALTDLVTYLNALLAAAAVLFAFFATTYLPLAPAFPVGGFELAPAFPVASFVHVAAFAVASFVLAHWFQGRYVRRRTDEYKRQHKAHFRPTHAGGVVYSADGGGLRYLIVRPQEAGKGEWVLPKGHIDPGEEPRQTAIREVLEETGVAAAVVDELPPVAYQLPNSAEWTRIRYFLMEKTGEDPARKFGNRLTKWVSYGEAIAQLSFPESKALLAHAGKMISK